MSRPNAESASTADCATVRLVEGGIWEISDEIKPHSPFFTAYSVCAVWSRPAALASSLQAKMGFGFVAARIQLSAFTFNCIEHRDIPALIPGAIAEHDVRHVGRA